MRPHVAFIQFEIAIREAMIASLQGTVKVSDRVSAWQDVTHRVIDAKIWGPLELRIRT